MQKLATLTLAALAALLCITALAACGSTATEPAPQQPATGAPAAQTATPATENTQSTEPAAARRNTKQPPAATIASTQTEGGSTSQRMPWPTAIPTNPPASPTIPPTPNLFPKSTPHYDELPTWNGREPLVHVYLKEGILFLSPKDFPFTLEYFGVTESGKRVYIRLSDHHRDFTIELRKPNTQQLKIEEEHHDHDINTQEFSTPAGNGTVNTLVSSVFPLVEAPSGRDLEYGDPILSLEEIDRRTLEIESVFEYYRQEYLEQSQTDNAEPENWLESQELYYLSISYEGDTTTAMIFLSVHDAIQPAPSCTAWSHPTGYPILGTIPYYGSLFYVGRSFDEEYEHVRGQHSHRQQTGIPHSSPNLYPEEYEARQNQAKEVAKTGWNVQLLPYEDFSRNHGEADLELTWHRRTPGAFASLTKPSGECTTLQDVKRAAATLAGWPGIYMVGIASPATSALNGWPLPGTSWVPPRIATLPEPGYWQTPE